MAASGSKPYRHPSVHRFNGFGGSEVSGISMHGVDTCQGGSSVHQRSIALHGCCSPFQSCLIKPLPLCNGGRRRGFFFGTDMKDTRHGQSMPGKGAHIGIISRFVRSSEIHANRFTRIDQGCRLANSGVLGDILSSHSGIPQHPRGPGHFHGNPASGFAKHPIMLHPTMVFENKPQ